ncbi:GL11808, partial [Drosophila persimilis]
RYVRIHDADSTVLLYQCYVKSKATKILIRQLKEEKPEADAEEEEEEEIDNIVPQKPSIKTAPVDDEYEYMFDQMPTVGDSEDESGEQVEETVKVEKAKQKRKGPNQSQKTKKKKV